MFCGPCFSQHKQCSTECIFFPPHVCSNCDVFFCRHSSSLCSLWPHGISEEKVVALEFFNVYYCKNIWYLGWPYLIFCSLDRQFSADEVLQLLDRFFNLEMLVIWEAQYLDLYSFYISYIYVKDWNQLDLDFCINLPQLTSTPRLYNLVGTCRTY